MAKKEYAYGDQATVTVAKTGYRSQTKTYTMTGDITDTVVLEEQSTTARLIMTFKNSKALIIRLGLTANSMQIIKSASSGGVDSYTINDLAYGLTYYYECTPTDLGYGSASGAVMMANTVVNKSVAFFLGGGSVVPPLAANANEVEEDIV